MFNPPVSRRKSYYKTLSISLFLSTYPLLLLALTIYIFGTRIIEKESTMQFERYFSVVTGNLDNQLQKIEIVGFQWGFNNKRILGYMDANFPEEFMVARSFQESLFHISTLSPLIKECYFWSASQPKEILYSSGNIQMYEDDTLNPNIPDVFNNALHDVRKIHWYFDSLFEENTENSNSIFLFIKVPLFTQSRNGLLILEIDKRDLILFLSPDTHSNTPPEEEVILFDHDMNIISSQGNCEQYFIDRELINEQITGKDSGVYVGDGRLFFYKKIKNKQWTAMSVMDIDKITKPVSDIAQIIILLVLFFLIASVILSIKASQSIYKPIKRMVESITNERIRFFSENDSEIDILNKYLSYNSIERKNLNRELTKHKDELRATIFNQLLNGDLSEMSDISIRQKMKEIGISLGQKKIGIIIVQLLEESYQKDHKAINILRFTAISILKNTQFLDNTHIIPCRDYMIAVIASFDEDMNSPKSRLWYYANEIKDLLALDLNIHTTVAMSDVIHDLSTTQDNYIRTIKTLSYRKLGNSDQIIDANRIMSYDNEIINYPYSIEKELLHAFQMGWKKELENEIENFFNYLSRSSTTIYLVHQQIRLLISNLIFTVMQSGIDPWELYNDRDLYEELKSINQINSIKEWLILDVVDKFIERINELQDIEYRRIVNDVYEIIQKEYSSPLLCLTYCSELLNTYPQKICNAFRKIEETNFLVYLTNYRLNKAKDLLKYSDIPINSIAEQVGYQASYFNRVFKKKFGLTPGDFRSSSAYHPKSDATTRSIS
jgi:AraC-like DNA-binding protein